MFALIATMLVLTGHAGAQAKGVDGEVDFAGTREYIVLYERGVDLGAQLRSEVRKGNEVEDRFDSSINGALLGLEAEDVNRLGESGQVLVIERNGSVSIDNQTQGTRSAASWGLDRVDQRDLPLNSSISTSHDGQGVEAYVLDTGIRLDHSQFTGRINPEGYSAFSGGWNDCQGHGTHVAGTIAGSTYGVAPAARLTAIRVLDCEGSGSWAGVIAGIDWMISDHGTAQPAVANMSLGGGRSDSINAAVQRAVDDGISMLVAAGNESSDACGRSPASSPNAVTVGSSTNTDAMSSFSNHGRCVDLFGPGSNIISAWHTSSTATATLSGTSMATPHVAGVAALVLSGQPAMNPAAVSSRLVASASPGRLTGINGCTKNLLTYAGSGADLPPPADGPGGPANDHFANRATLSSLSGVNGTTACATTESGEPSHGTGSSASIWYSWTAPSNGTLTLRTQGSSYDTLLAAYSGSSLSSLTQLAQNDDSGGGLWSQVSFQVTEGTTYSVAIDGWGGAAGNTVLAGSFSGGGDPVPPDPTRPANDNFLNRSSLGTLGGISASSQGATAESGEPIHYGSRAPHSSVWWSWTAPADGTLVLDTSGSGFDTVMAVYSGSSLGSLQRLANDDDSGDGPTSRLSLPVSQGASYPIAVDGYSFGASGAVRLAGSFSHGGGPGEPDPGDPGGSLGSGSVGDLSGSPSEGRYEFEISVTTNSNICDGGFCGWYPLAFAVPTDEQCSSTGETGSYAWVGDFSSDPGTQAARSEMYMEGNPPFRFCIYVYISRNGELDYHLIHETVLAPEGWEEPPASLPRPVITSGPPRRTESRTARFVFRGGSGTAFQCRVDRSTRWVACSSPRQIGRLSRGSHTFRVRQTAAGTVSPPAIYSWVVTRPQRR